MCLVTAFSSMENLQNEISGHERELDYYLSGTPSWIIRAFDTEHFRGLDEAAKTLFIKKLLSTPNGKSAVLSTILNKSAVFELVVRRKLDLSIFAADRDIEVIKQLRQNYGTVFGIDFDIFTNCTPGTYPN